MLKREKLTGKSGPVWVMLGFLLTLSLAGSCSKEDTKEEVVIPDIALNKSELTLEKGKTERLIASFTPAETPDKGHVWTSSTPGVAMVDETGMVTAVKPGEAVVTATALTGKKTATCKVTVVDKIVRVAGVSIKPTVATMVVGDDLALEATVAPENATNKVVAWSSSDSKMASVDATGKVTAIAEGKITIKATTDDGDKTASCQITIVHRGVEISKPEVSDITSISALVEGTVKPSGVKVTEVGICYSTSQSPTVNDKKVVLSGEDISYTLTKLEANTTYYVRIYAKLDGKYYYGDQGTFTTSGIIKTHFEATDIYEDRVMLTSAVPSGVTKVDVCYGTSPHPKITDNITTASVGNDGKLNLSLTGLSKGTTYYLRAYSRVGSKIEYYDDEVSVQTVGGEEFFVKVNITHLDGYLNLWVVCVINIDGTYLVEIDGDESAVFKKDVDYVKSLYIEDGTSTFNYRQKPNDIGNGYYYMSQATLVFTNIDSGVRYYYTIPYRRVNVFDYI